VDQHTPSVLGLRRSMQHLICGDIVQHHGDRFRRVQSRRHGTSGPPQCVTITRLWRIFLIPQASRLGGT
jgi:hypothetical protein